MRDKNIKLNVRKQIKKQYPNWKRLRGNLKKEIAQKVLDEAEAKYDFEQAIDAQRGASWHRRAVAAEDLKLDEMGV